MDEIAIKIEHVSKEYRLGAIGGGTLRGDLQSWMAKIRGKEDPNLKIGDSRDGRSGDRFLALDDVSFEVKKGEAVGIIGHNGAGKSTLLKLLSRVTAPTSGKISYNGRIASMLEVGTGFHPELTGRENVYMNGAILGMTRAEIDKKFDDIVAFAEMEKFIDTPVKRYSSGMYVKLAFSVAAHLDSEIMIMDEVLAVGDMAFQKKCLDKMRDAAKEEGRTVLYVSHNMNTIRQLCDRCIVLDKGKLVFEGEVGEAILQYFGNITSNSNIVDLKNLPRSTTFQNHDATMSRIEAVDHPNLIYPVGSQMALGLDLTCNRFVKQAHFRVMVRTAEGSSVTMAVTEHPVALNSDCNEHVDITLDISRLVPGKYSLNVVAFEVNEYGGTTNLDGLSEVLFFDIISVPGFNNNMEWLPRYWGYMYSEPLRIIKN